MRIEDALTQVRAIQVQLARTEQYCCYRSATVAVSGLVALGAAVLQSKWIADPHREPQQYLLLWISVAALSVAMIGAEMFLRWLRSDSDYARQHTVMALQQFAPCIVAGALVTWAIQSFCSEHAELFPALWAVLFSLGIFSSRKYLPDAALGIAVYYLLMGLVCLRWGTADQALRPWTMAITFGVGQLITSLVLYRHEEVNHESV